MRNRAELTRRPSAQRTEAVQAQAVSLAPRVDIFESEDELVLVADMPGVPKDALSVHLEGSELTIEGVQPATELDFGLRPVAFSRAFRVPNTVDANGVSAKLANGVLRVHLAKAEAAKPRQIKVKAG